MTVTNAPTEAEASLATLLSYLAVDPANPSLLLDTAEAALDAGQVDQARALLDRLSGADATLPRARHLAGLLALRSTRFDEAAATFRTLIAEGHDDPALRFNAAWSLTKAGDVSAAADVLDDATARALPQAAALRVTLLHTTGDLDAAESAGRHYLTIHRDHRALAAAMSTLAIDIEDEALAAECAALAPDHPDAIATFGTLALGRDDPSEAEALFDQVLARAPHVPRAWIGRGLAGLMTGKTEQASADLDRGATLFGDHLGSWIAAGWAHFVLRDYATSRARFDHALALDQNFAETHGSLAVLDILDGNLERARERVAIALRLDRECFSGALATALLATGSGDAAGARAIIERALHTQIDGSQRTVAQSLAKLGMMLR
ncbi:tetratricopeptide repeat protein [Sphingomonas phyllosphaerae]|uniref:tetratricopeptide repeat protein n=1 Tax=Sphingomonas phyllosphaerae TaxID=257003 RepID=UPI00041B68D1|nr:tetratricopeptide repeat protein [Sphingomonas phyllosphaerae]